MTSAPAYRTFSAYLKETFGQRVQKISLDAGLGCPHRDALGQGGCIYCNDLGSGTGLSRKGVPLERQIIDQIQALGRRRRTQAFIAYFQSFCNTYAPLERLQALYDTILPFPEIVGLAIGTRPDCVGPKVLDLIAGYAPARLVWVEYGLQSANDATLERINRGHDVACFIDAVNLTRAYPVRICAHAIIGLPGEGLDDYLKTACLLSALPVTDVKIHLLYVVRGTRLEELYVQGGYTPLTMEAYARSAALFLAHLRPDIVVQRITGDPHPHELCAPQWALDKAQVRRLIMENLASEGLVQGSLYKGGSGHV